MAEGEGTRHKAHGPSSVDYRWGAGFGELEGMAIFPQEVRHALNAVQTKVFLGTNPNVPIPP
jgi:hypothetical protein